MSPTVSAQIDHFVPREGNGSEVAGSVLCCFVVIQVIIKLKGIVNLLSRYSGVFPRAQNYFFVLT